MRTPQHEAKENLPKKQWSMEESQKQRLENRCFLPIQKMKNSPSINRKEIEKRMRRESKTFV